MSFPKLKYARLCRILSYVVVIGCSLLPILIICPLAIPDIFKVIVILGSLCGLLIYIVKNFMVLMTMDMALASLSCYRTARRQYTLPANRTADVIKRSILRYGIKCKPSPIHPRPFALCYKFSTPLTVYSRGIERVIAAYEVDFLDIDVYRNTISSAKSNSKSLIGKKKALFLDNNQKKSPLNRVTVVLILAHKIDPQIMPTLYDLVCKQCGDEEQNCIVPCIVNLEHRTCVFNCVRIPYIGFGYAVKNRGIRIIKNRVFGGNLNLSGNVQFLEPIQDMNQEDSLWDYWKELHHQFIGADRETKRRFESMSERQIYSEEEILYLKWDQRGICQTVELDTENRIAKIESVIDWFYPKIQPIGKKTIPKIEDHISSYYTKQGYTVEFVNLETIL